MTARETLAARLAELAEQGVLPVCAGRDAWISEDADQRDLAALLCLGCPVITECADAADETREAFGTWAGVDRTPTNRKKKEPRK